MTRGLKTSLRASKVRILTATLKIPSPLHIFAADKKFLEFFFKRVKPNTSGRYETEFPYMSPCGRETNYIRCDDLPIVFSHLLDSDNRVIEDVTSYGTRCPDVGHCDGQPSAESGTITNSTDIVGTAHDLSTTTCTSDSRTSLTDTGMSTQRSLGNGPDVDVKPPPLPTTTLSLAYGGTRTLTVPFQPSSLCMLPASGRVYHAGPERLGGVGLVKSSLAIELSRFFVYEDGARESAHPVGFRWQGRTWRSDAALLSRLAEFTNITDK